MSDVELTDDGSDVPAEPLIIPGQKTVADENRELIEAYISGLEEFLDRAYKERYVKPLAIVMSPETFHAVKFYAKGQLTYPKATKKRRGGYKLFGYPVQLANQDDVCWHPDDYARLQEVV